MVVPHECVVSLGHIESNIKKMLAKRLTKTNLGHRPWLNFYIDGYLEARSVEMDKENMAEHMGDRDAATEAQTTEEFVRFPDEESVARRGN
jgi:hypothetical protein